LSPCYNGGALDKHDDEPRLLERSRQGDMEAFNGLVERHQRGVYNLCLRMLGTTAAAEDATQDAFIAAFRAIRTFRGDAFRSWLYRIATNACYDEMRRRRSRPALSLDEPHGEGERVIDVPSAGLSPEDRAEHQELGRMLQEALSHLHPDQRIAIILCDVQGLDYAEIAEVLGISLGTVKSRIFRGRVQLRTVLLESGGELLPSRLRQVSEGQSHEPLQ
jgi:RNA polymerase sigma-70 factor, ECF subfamily